MGGSVSSRAVGQAATSSVFSSSLVRSTHSKLARYMCTRQGRDVQLLTEVLPRNVRAGSTTVSGALADYLGPLTLVTSSSLPVK